jgi:hypothetical protein
MERNSSLNFKTAVAAPGPAAANCSSGSSGTGFNNAAGVAVAGGAAAAAGSSVGRGLAALQQQQQQQQQLMQRKVAAIQQQQQQGVLGAGHSPGRHQQEQQDVSVGSDSRRGSGGSVSLGFVAGLALVLCSM